MFCEKCGNEIANESKFCPSCGAANANATQQEEALVNQNTEPQTQESPVQEEAVAPEASVITENAPPVYQAPFQEQKETVQDKINKIGKTKVLAIGGAALVALVVIIAVIISSISSASYKGKLEEAYTEIQTAAEYAEDYASLESKVWRNCIYENESYETDEYTQDDYGYFHDDFNDALSEFYSGEYLTYSMVNSKTTTINNLMSELKNPPSKFKDEYQALRELYVAYSDMADLVIGDSSYSLNSFTEALDNAKATYKNALSDARSYLE
ncbi:MAG: zinc ribbon domain-containing protein [Clostridia bacterium]|nr:zinc ribbon domain-containing protein [Clostridia bacterium]